jgi:hypothetical protein
MYIQITKALNNNSGELKMPTNLHWTTGLRVFQKDNIPEHYIEGTIVLSTRTDAVGLPLLYTITFMPRNPTLLDV